MIIIVFHIIFFLFPLLWFLLNKYSYISNSKISVLSYLNFNIFIFQYIGYFFLFNKFFKDRFDDGVNNNDLLFKTFLFNIICIMSVNISYFLFKNLFFETKTLKYLYCKLPNRNIYNNSRYIFYSIFILCLFVSFFYINSIGFQNLAIVKIFAGDTIYDVMEARSNMTNNFSGKLHWIKLFNVEILSFITLVFFGFFITFKSTKIKFLFYVSFLILAFNLLMSSEKGLIIDLFLMFLIYYYLSGSIMVNVKKITLKVGVGLILFLLIVYKLFMGLDFDINLLSAVFSRILGGQIDSAYYYVEYFDSGHFFLYGRSLPNPGGILPFSQFNLTQEIQKWKFPEFSDLNIIGSMPTIFWAESYANFGIFGILYISFFIGIMLFLVDYGALNNKKDMYGISFYVYLIFHFKNLAVTGISNFLVDINLIILFLFYLTLTKLNFKKNSKP
jgi:oligosaccharide repeat unit polymerase